MEYILLVAALILSQNYTPIQAAPSVESCPPDSILSEDSCKCNPESCVKPQCMSVLTIATNGSDLPGSCCPTYNCVGCSDDILIDDKCPCAPEAVLNSKNQCECVDKEKSLENGECVCNPFQCSLPQLCDRKSVPITIKEGCCKKTICQLCPSDSESTHLEGDELENHCVCLPCKNDCGNNRTVVIKKHGTGFPGNCCDLYECQKVDENKGCSIGNTFYGHGAEWLTSDQRCKCHNGLSLCTALEEKSQSCFIEQKIYKHGMEWKKEDGCTSCTCINGDIRCISHFCNYNESQIQKNNSKYCIKEGHTYQNFESWTEDDNCTNCTCINGEKKCTKEFCDKESNPKLNECEPLTNCNKTCLNGFKLNKKGCEVCKCNNVKFPQEILSKYNMTMKDLITIVEDYMNRRTLSSTIPTTTTTTTTPTPIVNIINTIIPNATNNYKKHSDENSLPSTTEPSIVPAGNEADSWIYIAIPILVCVIFVIAVAIMCVYKSRRKSSIDLSHCHYETVSSLNNNNTIKKTEQLL